MSLRNLPTVAGSLLLSLGVSSARYGVDVSVATDLSAWQCLRQQHQTSFGIARVYRSVGQVDANSPDSLKAAHAAGIINLHAYIFPCIQTSPYSIQNGIICDSPADQVLKSIAFLEENGVGVHYIQTEASGPPTPPISPKIRRIWLDIEGIFYT